MGWLLITHPKGTGSYLYGWLLSSRLFGYSLLLSTLPALFGEKRFSTLTLLGFLAGLLAGTLFGPNPAGAATGQTHRGWLIWGICHLLSILLGILAEHAAGKGSVRRKA